MRNVAVKSFYLQTGGFSLENISVTGCISLAIEKWEVSFYLCSVFSGLPVMYITFWFHVYSIIKLFSLSSIFVGAVC